jgi:hypothetical protein
MIASTRNQGLRSLNQHVRLAAKAARSAPTAWRSHSSESRRFATVHRAFGTSGNARIGSNAVAEKLWQNWNAPHGKFRCASCSCTATFETESSNLKAIALIG